MSAASRAALRVDLMAELRSISDHHWRRLERERRQHNAAELFAKFAEAMLLRLSDAGLDLDPVEIKHLTWLANGEDETFAVVVALLLERQTT